MDTNSLVASLAKCLGRLQRPAKTGGPPPGQVLRSDTQSLAETLACVAESQIGQREEGGNNRGPAVVKYQTATWLPPGPWKWCAAFVCWCVFQAIQAQGLKPRWPRPRTAGAYDLEAWAAGKYGKTLGAWQVITPRLDRPETWPRRGDIVTFTWSHTGIVRRYEPASRRVFTVEGNAGLESVSDSLTGDGVTAKSHPFKSLRRIIRHV